ncbi:MAG: hypothetical protein IT427_11910 [Pirellulales bacterium]|nr:hypothetical protein [Pirellulales bacterium]
MQRLDRTIAATSFLLALSLRFLWMINTARGESFVEPTQWDVGDLHSTSQIWNNGGPNSPIAATPNSHLSNPPLPDDPELSWTGAFVASSGGLYSFSGSYSTDALIPSDSPSAASGTYIIVQTAGTMNPDYDPEGDGTGGGILRNTIKVYDAANTLVRASDPADVHRSLYISDYPLYGGVGYEELIWQTFVPGLVGNFRIAADSFEHSSLQAIRIDSLVSVPTLVDGDFDGNGTVDGADFVAWQTNFPKSGGAVLTQGDANGDGNVDGADFVIWQTNFPFAPSSAASHVPEPTAILAALIGVGVLTFAARLRGRTRSIATR